MDKDTFFYYLILILTFPLRYLSLSAIHSLGRGLGWILFYCMRSYRKRTLSNLALAKDLNLSTKELLQTAKASFQNLAINCLEYPKFARTKNLSKFIQCENPQITDALYAKGQGIIFFCAHQSNWEVLFLDGTARMRGMAIGKPIKNKRLYHWILSIRQKYGGMIISPRNAIREGFKALKKGIFLGIVGDQGMPDSNYSFPFFGRRAWNSTAPALLAYRTNSPIIFAETRRVKGGYRIRYSDPFWPNLEKPIEQEIPRMMDHALTLLQESIRKSPGEWLWQHNRWKQQTPKVVYKPFRHDAICVVLPKTKEEWSGLDLELKTFREIYPLDFLFVFAPRWFGKVEDTDEVFYYENLEETLQPDFRFKLVFNFTGDQRIERHYLRLSAFEILDRKKLHKLAFPHKIESLHLGEVMKRALCRPGTIWK